MRLSSFFLFPFLFLIKQPNTSKGGPHSSSSSFSLFSQFEKLIDSYSLSLSRSSSKKKGKRYTLQKMDQHSGKEINQQIYKVNTHTLHTSNQLFFLSTPFFFIKRAENRRESSKKLLVKLKVGQLNVFQTTTTITISFIHSFVCLIDCLID